MKKYKYVINNLDCANCAREIEEYMNSLDEFNNVVVNFNTSRVIFESDKCFSLDELNKIVSSVEDEAYLTLNEENSKEYHLSVLIVAILLSLVAYIFKTPKWLSYSLYIISYALLLYKIAFSAIKMLIKNHSLNEYALITISCLGAFFIGDIMEGIMVVSLYTIGKILEEKAINNSRKSIKDLIDIKQSYANVLIDDEVKEVAVEDVKIDDIMIVKSGEKIPVDGIIIDGKTKVDTSSLTGESEFSSVKVNDEVLSGSINMGDVIKVKATKAYSDSTVYKILELLESATDKKTKTETIVARVSKIYTPIILLLAILIIVLLPLAHVSFSDALYRGLTFLVISCPCAIAISVPLSYFTGIGISSKNGILIKGSSYLDNVSNARNIIFDKTGTITDGTFEVKDIKILDNDYTYEEIVDILVSGEANSNHPIAKSFMKLSNEHNGKITNFKEISGSGISFDYKGKHINIGNKKLCDCEYSSTIHLSIDGKHVASIMIDDGIKDESADVVRYFNKLGINTYMFTGDRREMSLFIGKRVGIKTIKSEMLPTDKFLEYENVEKTGMTIFIGDGINDAPVLKRANVGISLGTVGSDSAIEASDIVLMSDDLTKLVTVFEISKYTKKIIKQNLIFACLVKLLILLLSVFGFANMWMAVFADTGVTLLTILNTLRIMRKKY
ncbi:heavy metal-translocating P-type ATPase Cd/Co/Hg/Pb/Zn-transporting [Firmicutes bacterium CAG:582]|nr:heavy metal-translocating P-type ATPase Cd/Co/Hg/Pb/Zn-transporting [Firmicutes bacterium CAG:582]